MSSPKEFFLTIGKCYYFSLALHAIALLLIGTSHYILSHSPELSNNAVIVDFLESYQILFIILSFYFSICMVLNFIAAISFYHLQNPKFLILLVLINLLSFPLGTMISLFTL